MYDFDMMESFYDDFDDDEFTEACRECDFDDLFVENEYGECDYVGDVYTEAFGKKKKSGFSMPLGSSKKKSGFSLGNNKKKKKKNGGKSFSNLPTPAKITATVAAALAVAAGIIVSIKAIAKHIQKKYADVGFDASKENYNEMIANIKERMKKLKSTHKDYCKAHKNMTKAEKQLKKEEFKNEKKLLQEQMQYARLGKFCTEKFSVISMLINGIKGIGTKIAKKHREKVPVGQVFTDEFEAEAIEQVPETKVVRTKHVSLKPMDVEEAILQMELLGHDFFIYTDAEDATTNVLYRREDGELGLIEAK